MAVSFSFSVRLQNLLSDTGYKQVDLAKYLGLKPATISAWISEKAFPTYDKLESIARFFRMSVPELLGGDPEKAPSPSLIFHQDRDNISQIPSGADVSVEIRAVPEVGDIVLYKSGDEARFLRLAAYRDGISVLMSDKPGDPPVISKDSDSEIIGTATAILLKRQKKTASDGRSETGDPGEETSSSTIIYNDDREV